ncbi:SusD/RagB family nutrient-binding outer membrane lipoprotein [Yeosuana marina]|uniref:SusD/RagB family nutrient-binding outer membrane lipoprotein n=1 Tax=Yeosuana marina TaxID=1565536 RepID=UPI001423BC61|nr:SusD/RagB family nutrient-binding outer membrane lipoprotein [Yeosuana marina]
MKKILKIYLFVIVVGFTACNDQYFDINTPVDSVPLDQLDMKDLMGPVLYNTMLAQYYASVVAGNYSQYFGGYGYSAAGKSEMASTWSNIYLRVLPNLKLIKDKANEKGALHYGAVALIVEAANIGLAADMWDKIPYSQAGQSSKYPHPDFDSQEQIYNSVFSLLDEAIHILEAPDNSFINMGSEDLIYGGDFDKWLRAAYTLKARFQLHLVQKGITTPNDVLTSIANGFTSNDDNFMMVYPENELNPWYQGSILTRQTGNYFVAPNDQIVSMMNGTSYPFQSGVITEDPRLHEIYQNEGDPGDPWRGGMNGGIGDSSDGEPLNTFFKEGGYYTSSTSPLILITYAEAMFIKAEAAFLSDGGTSTSTGSTTEAYNAYMAGISASMDQIGVDGTDYMADTSVDVGEAGLMLNHIMKEKYIANNLNAETYNDLRRYDFSSDVFKDLAIRLNLDDVVDDYDGLWFRRAIYPTSEKNANPKAFDYEEEPTVSVWWAQ